MKFSFLHLIRFRVDNTGVFHRHSTNLNMTVGQAACRLLLKVVRWFRKNWQEFVQFVANIWQKNFENGNVFCNFAFSMFNVLFNSYFVHTFEFLNFDCHKIICFNRNQVGAK